jgi:CBS-domain-containing membrane protein
MTSDPVTIEPQASVVDAARRMIQKEKGPLPVVEVDARPVGMVTDRDIIARVVAEGRDPGSVTVEDIATRELVTIGADQDFAEAARLMEEHGLDRLLVVEGERLVGIISEADIRLDEGPLAWIAMFPTARQLDAAHIFPFSVAISLPAGPARNGERKMITGIMVWIIIGLIAGALGKLSLASWSCRAMILVGS